MIWPATAAQIAAWTGGELVGDGERRCERAIIDTRRGVREGDLFVALQAQRDGDAFVRTALDAGAAVALCSKLPAVHRADDVFVVVADTTAAIQALATIARSRFAGPVVAITGSNGKTTTKEMLVCALSDALRVTGTPLGYNSQVGVAQSLLGLDPGADVAIIECGISQPGEMKRLQRMVRPTMGIWTNVGSAHLEGLGSREGIAEEKVKLFSEMVEGQELFVPQAESLALLSAAALACEVVEVEPARATQLLTASWASNWVLRTDAALAVACALALGVSQEEATLGLSRWQPSPGRLEWSSTTRGLVVINDAYTADPESVAAALRFLQQERTAGRSIAVLGGMAQLGKASLRAHREVGALVARLGVDRLIGVGEGGAEIVAAALEAGMAATAVATTADAASAAKLLEHWAQPGDRVLLKGSRPARLETVAAELLDAVSSTLLHVDIDAIVENYRRLRVAAGGVSVMPVVKSYGYGVDSVRIAQALERVGASCFCVAFPDEGIALRARGINAAILVQNVLPHEMGKLLRENLSAELGTMTTMRELEAAAAQQQTVARVHIKFDTGMGRVGFLPAELEQVLAFVLQSRALEVVGLMTHLASADEPARDIETRAQIAAFERIVTAFAEAGITPRWVHAANTAGAVRFPASRYSGIRAGIGLFGFAPDAATVGLQQALRLVTRLVSVKELPAEHGVGYGHTYSTGATPQRIAVAALGYNDGYPRSLSNRGWMSIRGERCPVVGRVCMDVTMLDVTHLDPPPRAGDEVVVFGAGPGEPDLEALAELADTISYEMLTRVSPRVRRIFHASAG